MARPDPPGIDRLTAALGSGSEAQLTRALEMLVRLGLDRPAVADAVRVSLDQRLPQLVHRAIASNARADLRDALRVAVAVYRPKHGAIDSLHDLPPPVGAIADLATEVLLTAAVGLEETGQRAVTLASVHQSLAVAFHERGEQDHAVAAARRAVGLLRSLADRYGGDYRSDLAGALDALGVDLTRRGDFAGAFDCHREALDLYRELASNGDEVTVLSLAHCLINHSVDLGHAGQHATALSTLEEAVGLLRRMAPAGRGDVTATLAWALHNQSIQLGAVHRDVEALSVVEEAVLLRRRLADLDPERHRPDLGSSLNALANRLGALGRRTEALAALTESVDIYRSLAAVSDRHLPGLAAALNNLSVELAAAGRPRSEALAASTEAVDIRRALVRQNRGSSLAGLAAALHNQATHFDNPGDAALAAAEEAVALRRLVAQENPAASTDLARSLRGLSVLLSKAGRPAEATRFAREAVQLLRSPASPSVHPDLARALGNLSIRLGEVDQYDEALRAVMEAVDLRRGLPPQPGRRADLATALVNMAVALSRLGREEEAVAAVEESVQVRRELAAENPSRYLADLASSLSNLAANLNSLQRHADALAAALESVTIAGELVDAGRGDLAGLFMSCGNLADALRGMGWCEDAEQVFVDLLGSHSAAEAKGLILLERAWWRVPSGDVESIVADGLDALPLLDANPARHASARTLLRLMRARNPAIFDAVWADRGGRPPWLEHTHPGQETVDLVHAWMELAIAGDDEQAFLAANPELLSGEAEAVLERLIDANPGHAGLRYHRELLVDARALGVRPAYERHHEQLWRDEVTSAIDRWLQVPEEDLRSRLKEDGTLLLSDEAQTHAERLLATRARTPDLLWRLGLLALCRADGVERGFAVLTDVRELRRAPGRRAIVGRDGRSLALARVRAGREPDGQEARFVHAVVALVAGCEAEAHEAILHCRHVATSWKRPERARQLTALAEVRPDLTNALLRLRHTLLTGEL